MSRIHQNGCEVAEKAIPVPRRRDDLVTHEIDGETILFDETYITTYRMNATARFIWGACDGKKDIDEIAQMLTAVYEVSRDRAKEDVRTIVQRLQIQGLLKSESEQIV